MRAAPSVTPIGAASAKASRPGPRRFARRTRRRIHDRAREASHRGDDGRSCSRRRPGVGVVDVPLLPGPEPVVVTTPIPVETVPPTVSATTTVVASTTIVALSPSSAGTTVTRATVPGQPPSNATPGFPTGGVDSSHEDGASGCDFGQETSGRPAGESNGDVPDRRPDVPANTVVLPIDPCTRGEDDQPRPSEPADTSRGNGAPSSVPGANGGDSVGGSPGRNS